MTTKRRYSLSDTRIEEHLRLLEQIDIFPLTESCCDICHCDCYNSHRSEAEDSVHDLYQVIDQKHKYLTTGGVVGDSNIKTKRNSRSSTKKLQIDTKRTPSTLPNKDEKQQSPRKSKDREIYKIKKHKKRSKSVCSQRSQSECSERRFTRDCEILQDLLTSLEGSRHLPPLEIRGESKQLPKKMQSSKATPQTKPNVGEEDNINTTIAPIRLTESMANLCLVPSIREAYHKVPAHDKRILNRMATKRSEKAVSKENAWLARKYWENERYERELLKCEQMEEYKKAVRDKQFQDYLQTKARLNDIAQRDLSELQRLRECLRQKDTRTKKRLQNLRNERDLAVNQKRYEELRKVEHVTVNQEEHNLDDMLRKSDLCQRLTDRLKRADFVRNQMLENYLKRLRYDNYIEQLQHEEHWREVQQNEKLKREQLKEQISRKRCRSQHFVESKQKHNEAIRKTAKLSKSLRDLVRLSVTPDTGVTLYAATNGVGNCNGTSSIVGQSTKMLFDHCPY